MPRHPQKTQYKDVKNRVIFLMRSPKSKEFFVGHCLPNSLMPIFRQHWSGDRNYTDKCFIALKNEGIHPCLTILEEVFATPVEAYRYVIAWTKIFEDAGYINLNKGNISDYLEDLYDNSLAIYKERRDKNLKEICDCRSCLVANYNRKQCPYCTCGVANKMERPKDNCYAEKEQREKMLHIRLSEEELEEIEKNARACDKTVSAYVRKMALDMCTLYVEHECITEHTHELSSYRNAINMLVFTIIKTKNYVPADIEYILEKTNQVMKLEGKFLNQHMDFVDKSDKLIRKTVRQTVNEHLSKSVENKERNTKN